MATCGAVSFVNGFFFFLIVDLNSVEKPGTVWQKLRESKVSDFSEAIIRNDLIFYKSWAMKPEMTTTPKAIHHDRQECFPWLPAGCPLGDKWFQSEDWSVTPVTALTLVLHQRKGCFQQTSAGSWTFSGGKRSASFLSATHHRPSGRRAAAGVRLKTCSHLGWLTLQNAFNCLHIF